MDQAALRSSVGLSAFDWPMLSVFEIDLAYVVLRLIALLS